MRSSVYMPVTVIVLLLLEGEAVSVIHPGGDRILVPVGRTRRYGRSATGAQHDRRRPSSRSNDAKSNSRSKAMHVRGGATGGAIGSLSSAPVLLVTQQLQSVLRVLLSKSTVAKFITGYWMVQGFRSGINAVRFWERNGNLKLQSDDLAAWTGEVIGLVTFSKALLTLLIWLRVPLNPLESTALCTIPCLVFWLREWLTGTIQRLGFVATFGPLLILHAMSAIVATVSHRVPLDWIQTYGYILPLLFLGGASWLFPVSTADDVGIDLTKPGDIILWVFVGRSWLSLGALLSTLLRVPVGSGAHSTIEKTLITAIRNSTLVTAVTTLLDVIWLRQKTFAAANFSRQQAARFTAITFFLAALLYLLPGP